MLDRLALFNLVGRRLDYADQRHTVLARNLANADTPGFVPHDLVEPDFRRPAAGTGALQVGLVSSHPQHFQTDVAAHTVARQRADPADIKPSGNAVSLDIEAGKLRSNSGQHRLATVVYGKYMDLLRSALGQA